MMEKISEPRILSKLFPLYQRNYIIQDSEGDVWFFKESPDNGWYLKYTIRGKTLGGIFSRSYEAYINCKFSCLSGNQEIVSVFIEDMVAGKREKHIGSWLINRLILFLKSAERSIQFDKVYGHFLPDNEKVADTFYWRFGFDINPWQNNRKIVIAKLEDLKSISLPDIKEIPIEDVVKEWFKSVKDGR